MKTQFELEDIKAVASTAVEMITPLLREGVKITGNDTIFDQDELAAYLKVSRSWVDQKISQNEIPHFRCGKYPRFRKSDIDKWVSNKTIPPAPLSIVKKMKK